MKVKIKKALTLVKEATPRTCTTLSIARTAGMGESERKERVKEMEKMTYNSETVRDVCAEIETCADIALKEGRVFFPREVSMHFERVLSAHEREIAAKDAEIESLRHKSNIGARAVHDVQEMKKRITLLERELKPVMEVDVPSVIRLPSVGEPKVIRDLYYAQNAVREAQRIMKESENGESHN